MLVIGLGRLGREVLDAAVCLPGNHRFVVGGRNLAYLRERSNLALFAANQQGMYPRIDCVLLDLDDVERAAETIAAIQPDLIFCAATMQRWGVINEFPPELAHELWSAQIAMWLPLHLTLVYKLMLAVRMADVRTKVVNATYPDLVHAVLDRVGLAPLTGIGDLANNVPALRWGVARQVGSNVEDTVVRFVAQHHLSYWMSRRGYLRNAPFHLAAFAGGADVTPQIDLEMLFDELPRSLKRAEGYRMTVASAIVMLRALLEGAGVLTHAPGPRGLPGGYPVWVSGDGVDLSLPSSIPVEAASRLNTASQRLDGIDRIDADGTVHFTERPVTVFKELLDYECPRLALSDCEARATELLAKYQALAARFH